MFEQRGAIWLSLGLWEKESIIDIHCWQENPNPRVDRSSGILYKPNFPLGRRIRIFLPPLNTSDRFYLSLTFQVWKLETSGPVFSSPVLWNSCTTIGYLNKEFGSDEMEIDDCDRSKLNDSHLQLEETFGENKNNAYDDTDPFRGKTNRLIPIHLCIQLHLLTEFMWQTNTVILIPWPQLIYLKLNLVVVSQKFLKGMKRKEKTILELLLPESGIHMVMCKWYVYG